jgi:tRNA A37 threonylcarbamoyladenosine biosynthesis protein TsaE
MQFEEHLFDEDACLLLVEWGDRWESPPLDDRWDINISLPEEIGCEDENFRLMDFSAYGMRALENLSRAYEKILARER